MRDPPRTGLNAFSTTNTSLCIHEYSTRFPTHGQGFSRTSLYTRVVLTLDAEMWKFNTWNKHKNSYAGGFRPYAFFMKKRTNYFTSSAAAAL
jgi:hypothetical protein